MDLHELCRSGTKESIESYLELVCSERPDDLGYVLDLKNEMRYAPLHCAIFARNLDAVKVLAAQGADLDAKCHGIPPLHLCIASAVQPGALSFASSSVAVLLENGVSVTAKDDNGFSALHLAAELNLPTVVESILKYSEDAAELVNGSSKLTGITALHKAAASDAYLAAQVLLDNGASVQSKTSALGLTPLHLAGQAGNAKVWAVVLKSIAGAARAAALSAADLQGRTPLEVARRSGWTVDTRDDTVLVPVESNQESGTTSIVTNPLCAQHHTCPPSQVETPSAPPENTKRLHVLVHEEQGALCAADLRDGINWVRTAKPAALADVLRVHEWSYVRRVQEHCASIESADPEDEEGGYAHLDGDTAVSCETYNAALAAAGAVCEAVDLVAGHLPAAGAGARIPRSAFCPVRPPGHHAGPRGLVKSTEPGAPDSHGFCILNNVSIGAAYAMNRYRETVHRVAIVDFDVHHGNGTEETVRWLKPSVEATPIKGAGGEVLGLMQSLSYKPWHSERDASNVMFVSVHGYGPRERGLEHMLPMAAFYPGTGRTVIPEVPRSHTPGAPVSGQTAGATRAARNTAAAALASTKTTTGLSPAEMSDEEGHSDGDRKSDSEGSGGWDQESSGSADSDLLHAMQQAAERSRDGTAGNGLAPYQQLMQARRMYSSFAHSGGAKLSAQNLPAPAPTDADLPPLILDIGVPLPGGADGVEGADRGKVLDELNYRIQWRRYFREQIFPRLCNFRPNMIFISAGFDAHKKDGINAGYIALVEEDFAWVTDKLVQLANSYSQGRIVSVLEGGYQLGGEFCSAFAQSVKAHVRSLSQGARTRAPFELQETQAETALELQHLATLEEARRAQLLRKEQAREQAYLARMRELEQQQQLEQEQQEQGEAHQSSRAVDATAVAAAPAAEAGEEGAASGPGRKRRRNQVDYVALDRELRGENQSVDG